MKMAWAIGWLSLTVLSSAVRGDSVPVQLIFLSPQIFPASDREFGLEWRMSVSAFDNPNSANHELGPATTAHGFSHEGFFLLEDPTFFETIPLFFVLDIPEFRDADSDGIYDFYDRDVAVEGGVTEGFHSDGFGSMRQFAATWTREAGSGAGSVIIDMPFLGRQFTHPTALLTFAGQYDFTRSGTNLAGAVALTNSALETDLMTGPLPLSILDSTNGVLELRNSVNLWNGPGDFVYRFATADLLERVSTNNLTVFLAFEDGQPGTAEPDYLNAVLVLSSEDANANGILDLVEQTARPRPSLKIERIAQGVRISITGEPNGRYDLESAAEANAAAWGLEQTLVLSGAQGSVTNAASGPAKFFRARLRD